MSTPALPSLSVCASTDGASCNAGADWEDGWIVFVRTGGDDPPFVDAGETVVRVSPATGNDITVRGLRRHYPRRHLGIRGIAQAATASTGGRITFIHAHARQVELGALPGLNPRLVLLGEHLFPREEYMRRKKGIRAIA